MTSYKDIIEEAKQIAEDERQRPPADCPVCGSPLQSARGLLNCPMGDYRTAEGSTKEPRE